MRLAFRLRFVAAPVLFATAVVVDPRLPSARAEDTDPPPGYVIRIAHEATAGTLRRVLDHAGERLAEPRCQEVLDDFTGNDGRPLRLKLDELGLTPKEYLRRVVFYDGGRQPRCTQKGILAVTHVGSRIVYICPEELRRRARQNPLWTEATLIHEALHTLGLGENPPSSREITSVVIRKCRH